MAKYAKNVSIVVTKEIIEEAKCRLPTKCMLKVAAENALRKMGCDGRLYIHVDATGVAITRRNDYREKAFLPAPFVKAMLAFDREEEVKPFRGTLKFFKTTRIQHSSEEAKKKNRATTAKWHAERKAAGKKQKRSPNQRVVGLTDTTEAA